MENKIHSALSEQFHDAINFPSSVEEDVLLALIDRYPYVQALRFAYEKKQYLIHQGIDQNISSTLLYASSPSWLYEYVHQPEKIKTVAVEETNVVETVVLQESEVIVEELEEVVVTEEGDEELNRLIHEGATQDYFLRENYQEEETESEVLETIPSLAHEESKQDEQERVTVYDDDTLPYSFLWWLHKTRLEYADTYQPYLKGGTHLKTNEDEVEKIHEKLDAQLLDQQIRENIFHLQSPESKMSTDYKKTVAFQIPRKADKAIEKFIREEPMIKPLQPEKLNLENKARKSSEDENTLVTETLAKIYAEQGLYPKAIEVYTKLVLKFPEKNAYFATRIKELEQKLN